MFKISKFPSAIFAALICLGVTFWWIWSHHQRVSTLHQASDFATATPENSLSLLAPKPNWNELLAYQGSISREQFMAAMIETYSLNDAWRGIAFEKDGWIEIIRGPGEEPFCLEFASAPNQGSPHRSWRTPHEIPASPDLNCPLLGVRIAIDPGHIGGRFARMEGRHFTIEDSKPVKEGEMTLLVAKLLKSRLEKLGAIVFLTRSKNAPVTELRSDHFLKTANPTGAGLDAISRQNAEQLFYRQSEIRARSALLHERFQPDLCLCLHFNAEPWGDPSQASLTEENHFHLLINGAYDYNELLEETQRFQMLRRLLQGMHETELALALPLARYFAKKTGLPPFHYSSGSMTLPTSDPYVWKRNLLANRIFPCPVLYFEPYVMNSRLTFERIMAGDYSGERIIAGQLRKSIFREYADATAEGLVLAFDQARKSAKSFN